MSLGLLDDVGTLIETEPLLALVAVFLGGLLTASNPCVLAMIPLTMSFVAGRRETGFGALRALGFSALFVLGLCVAFVALGMAAALAGRMYGETSPVWNWVVAAVCLVMGLHLAGVLRFEIPVPAIARPSLESRATFRPLRRPNVARPPSVSRGASARASSPTQGIYSALSAKLVGNSIRGPVGALVLGLLFGLVSTPCAAPMLVVLLTWLAGTSASVAWGGVLLLVYALGHSVLILVAGTSMGAARALIESRRWTGASAALRRVAGVVIVLAGVFFAWEGLDR